MTDPQQPNPTNEPPPPPPQDPEAVVNESRRLEEMRIENENENKLPIKTYHCRFCSHLLLASTRELLSSSTPLRRRRRYNISKEGGEQGGGGEGGLDGALILEIPSAFENSRRRGNKKKMRGSQDNETTVGMNPTTTTVESTSEQDEENRKPDQETEQAHYTIPLSTLVPDPNPLVIRREDGFEKRVVLRCGRCRVIVGYELDNGASSSNNNNKPISEDDSDVDLDEDEEEEGDEFNKARKNRKDRVIYLLPGSIVGTEDLEVGLDDGTGREDVLNAMVERNPVLKGMEREWMAWIEK